MHQHYYYTFACLLSNFWYIIMYIPSYVMLCKLLGEEEGIIFPGTFYQAPCKYKAAM